MRLVVLGATGKTGAALVEQGLAGGHEVTVIARRPEAVPQRPSLEVVTGSITDADALRRGITGADAVVNVVGVSGLLAARRGTTVYSAGTRAVLSAMTEVGVRRLVAVSSGGVIDQPGDGWFYRNILKRHFLEPIYRDMRIMEAQLRASEAAWTIVRPPYLTGTTMRTDYRIAIDQPVPDDKTLSPWSLAHLLLAEATGPGNVGRVVCVSY